MEKAKHNCLSTEKSKSEKDRLTADGGETRERERTAQKTGKSGGGRYLVSQSHKTCFSFEKELKNCSACWKSLCFTKLFYLRRGERIV